MLREIRDLIPNPARCHLVPYNTTDRERDVALSLGIPMYGSDPRLSDLGSKTGCRRIFEELGVRCPVGADDLRTVDEIVAAIQEMRRRRPTLTEAIVKLNEGVSGSGNALVDLHDLPELGFPRRTRRDQASGCSAWPWRTRPSGSRTTWTRSPPTPASSRNASPASG